MQTLSLDPIGFGIPAVLSTLFLVKTFKSISWADVLLMLGALAVTYVRVNRRDDGLYMTQAYVFVVIYYVFANMNVSDATKFKPAGLIFAMFFISMVIPDILGAIELTVGAEAPTVGGAGWMDGLLLWPMCSAAVYGVLAAVQVSKLGNGKKALQTWPSFFRHHFKPF